MSVSAIVPRVASDSLEELSPYSSAPTNPLAPLLTPFKNMKMPAVAHKAVAGIKKPFKTKAATAAAAAATAAGVPVDVPTSDGQPPQGYLWVWMGSFRRWQRRFIVASEQPGVLLMYKARDRQGKVLSISLRNVDIHEDASDPRQLKIITPKGYIFLRTSSPEDQAQWLACLRESVRLYRANLGLVEKLKDKGLLPQPAATMLGGGGGFGVCPVRCVQDETSGRPRGMSGSIPLPETAEMDMEQRKRIRLRLNEKLAEIVPFQREVERHMKLLSSQLLGVVSGLNVQLPSLTASSSMMRVGSFQAASGGGARPNATPAGATRSPAQHATTPPPALDPAQPPPKAAHPRSPLAPAPGSPAAGGTPAGTPEVQSDMPSFTAGPGELAGLPGAGGPPGSPWSASHAEAAMMTPTSSAAAVDNSSGAAGVGAGVKGSGTPELQRSKLGPSDSVARSADGFVINPADMLRPTLTLKAYTRPMAQRTQNLQQAFGQLLESVRYALHSQANRIAELEAENLAYQSAIKVLKQQQERAWQGRGNPTSVSFTAGHTAGSRTPVRTSHPHSGPSHALPMSEGSDTGEPDDDDDDDEDDDTANGDSMSVMTADEDAFDVVEAFDDSVDYSILDMADDVPVGTDQVVERTHSMASRPLEGGADDLGASAKVLNALEVVRQVDYVERLEGSRHLTKVLATHEPPDSAPTEDPVTDGKDDNDEDDCGDDEEEGAEAGGSSSGVAAAGAQGSPVYKGRSKLPAPKPLGRGFSIWSILKNMIGKDLTRITMPATINEPTSTLQRLAEGMEYRELLDSASSQSSSVDRLMYVAVWVLSCYTSQAFRDGKPFNPLLGETYEWQAPDGSARYFCEQVSHHPPVLAYVADSEAGGWEVQGELETKSKFWGKSAEMVLWGCEALKLKKWNEEYRFNRATICVHDVLLGNFWIEVYGKVRIESSTGEVATLHLKPCKRRLEDRGKVEGTILDAHGKPVWTLSGSTADHIYAQLTPAAATAQGLAAQPAPQLIWSKAPYPPDAAEQYWFTRFAIGLNDPADRIVPHLPPTDTRFRPDQRALEEGEWNRATSEKLRLEEKQRQARRDRNKLGLPYYPLWFKQADTSTLTRKPEQPGFAWQFTGDYWARRQAKDWSVCPDLYSEKPHVIKAPESTTKP